MLAYTLKRVMLAVLVALTVSLLSFMLTRISGDPALIIADKPTSALDVSVQAQILNLLLNLRREFGLTYILISHNLSIAEHLASRVPVMYLGRIMEEAPTPNLFGMPRHSYSRALLASVLTPQPGLGLPETHLGIAYPNPIDPPSGCTFYPRCPKVKEVSRTVPPSRFGRTGEWWNAPTPHRWGNKRPAGRLKNGVETSLGRISAWKVPMRGRRQKPSSGDRGFPGRI